MTDNGTEHILNTSWKVAQRFTIAGDTKVVTIKGDNPGSVGGILASFSNGVVTDGTWQCADMSSCTTVECENSVIWHDAQTYGVNGETNRPWQGRGRFEEIESTAKWIWVHFSEAKRVWCKKTFGKSHKMTCSRQHCVNRNTRNMSLHETLKQREQQNYI